jgi:antirestriction protein ArdC
MPATTTPRPTLHAEITANIIAAIERNPGNPQMPWRRTGTPLWMPENALSKKPYNGINVINLWVRAEARGFTSPIWASFKQWQEIGAQVRKGAKSECVIFYREYAAEPDPTDDSDDGKRRVARASRVFNANEVDGFAPPTAPERLGPIARIAAVDRFIAATGARIEHGGESAYYAPATDHIQMPDEALFCGTDSMSRDESYFAVLLHEATHWTSPPGRCDRNLTKRFGKAERAAEELVAEIGAAFLCAELGVTQDVRPDHAAYVANWLTLLKSDDKAIFTAAAKASQAVAYLKSLQPPEA